MRLVLYPARAAFARALEQWAGTAAASGAAIHSPDRMLALNPMLRVTVTEPITFDNLRQLVPGRFRDFVKGVVDLRRGVLLLDADMQADQEAALLAEGADQRDLWGITCTRSSMGRTGSSSIP